MGLQVIITLALVLLNGFFVAAEFAIVKVRASQIELEAQNGSAMAKTAKNILKHLDAYLAATQLGITIASLGLGWVGESVMTDIIRDFLSFFGVYIEGTFANNALHASAFAVITVLHIVFGELAPKTMAIQKPAATTMVIAVPLQLIHYIFKPFIWVLNGFANVIIRLLGFKTDVSETSHSSEELQYLLEQGKESGALNDAEHELLKNVFDFNERVVKNIMVPRTKIVGIELKSTQDELIDTIITEGYSRIPVYDETIDSIVGIIHAKDVLPLLVDKKEFNLKMLVRKPYFIAENKKINDLMNEFQLRRLQIAIVLDEFGGTAGMVTLEDIVEELVGEIQDEYDEENPFVEEVAENEFVVDASASVHDVNEYLPRELPTSNEYDSISGLVIFIFDKIPDVGESQEFDGYVFTILRKTQQNIESVKIEALPQAPSDDE